MNNDFSFVDFLFVCLALTVLKLFFFLSYFTTSNAVKDKQIDKEQISQNVRQ